MRQDYKAKLVLTEQQYNHKIVSLTNYLNITRFVVKTDMSSCTVLLRKLLCFVLYHIVTYRLSRWLLTLYILLLLLLLLLLLCLQSKVMLFASDVVTTL